MMSRYIKHGVVLSSRCINCQRSTWLTPKRIYSQKSGQQEHGNPFIAYLRNLKWVPIPLGVGFAYISYQQYGHVRKRETAQIQNAECPQDLVARDWQVKIYTALPLKVMSRMWGRLNGVELPEWMRSPVLRFYIWAFDCNLEEAAIRNLKHYKNLGEFFRRRLRPGCRPVDGQYLVTSPSDGKVLHFGRVEQGLVEQVKGVTYSLAGFLGPAHWSDVNNNRTAGVTSTAGGRESEGSSYQASVMMNSDTDLYHCVIYLAPGDYHGFHSPTQWTVQHRRHFPGDLLSVNPGIARWIKGLFNLNERALYMGKWAHGFFSMAAVGATNVGSIKIYMDQALCTNQPGSSPVGAHYDRSFTRPDMDGISMKKGEHFGEFNLGSTIVLVFEAPKLFEFDLVVGQKIKYGQALGTCR